MVRRDWDLTTPTSVPADAGASKVGGYEAMARFIEQRVKPDIEKRFPIDRKRQTLAGHSLGGLFALRTLINHRDAFQAYIAMSPSIWWNDAAVLKDASVLTPTPGQLGPRVYIGVVNSSSTGPRLIGCSGKPGCARRLPPTGRCSTPRVSMPTELAQALRDKGLEVHFDMFPDEDHFSVIPSEIGRAVPYALAVDPQAERALDV